MLACVGYIVPEYVKFPGFLSPSTGLKFADIPSGLGALSKVPGTGIFQWVVFCGLCDLFFMHQVPENPPGKLSTRLFGEATTNYEYGAFGIPGYLGGKPIADGELKQKKLNAELANGRLAMMAIMGMFFQDGLTGSAWGDWALFTDSPLRAFENELGAQAPFGFFDPLGLTKDGDAYSFKRRRSVEIKHGRVCMLATMGYITPEVAGHWPGYLSFSEKVKFADIPNGLAAISKVPGLGWFQIIAYAAFCEINAGYDADINKRNEPGNMGWRPPLLSGRDPEARKRSLASEIANGRLAMMAIMGMLFQDGLTGSAWGDWALYTDSPLRAFEGELGAQAPTGFFDPLGFCADGDVESFRNRREAEIKHGRVAMFATIGLITPEFFKFPGYLAPTQGLKFADVPNGLAALGKVPAAGVFQWVALCGLYETCVNIAVDPAEPGNYGKGQLGMGNMVLGITGNKIQDPEKRKRGLNSEIANGRLAMMAVIGLFVQEGLTGSPYGLYH
ncbi:unnamed protein product [Polarella glacialis]|uniref:Uncharacterized protein n=1 Tax=Polarella glacialis TaxID=89957 RepID=A0A813FHH7_POLGL|nr:unnamed protein product [Polarella glacialis]CAE8725029.1 unnamed protein product [Polarella glacialis]